MKTVFCTFSLSLLVALSLALGRVRVRERVLDSSRTLSFVYFFVYFFFAFLSCDPKICDRNSPVAFATLIGEDESLEEQGERHLGPNIREERESREESPRV